MAKPARSALEKLKPLKPPKEDTKSDVSSYRNERVEHVSFDQLLFRGFDLKIRLMAQVRLLPLFELVSAR